jgi:hypothetical protein
VELKFANTIARVIDRARVGWWASATLGACDVSAAV